MSTSPISDTKRVANRLNARKSTGPRTPRGKAIAAVNGLRHGLFARELLLAGESADELLALKTEMIQSLDPRHSLELELVGRVVEALWKIRRLQRFERVVYQQQAEEFAQQGYEHREAYGLGHREPIPAEVAWHSGGEAFQQQVERIETLRQRLENGLHRALRQLEKLRKQAGDAPGWFAEEALVAERRQHENWQPEATDASALAGAAQVAGAQEKREQLRIDREEEAFAAQFPDEKPADRGNVARFWIREDDDEEAEAPPPENRQLKARDEAAEDSPNRRLEATPLTDPGATALPLPVRGERVGERGEHGEDVCGSVDSWAECT